MDLGMKGLFEASRLVSSQTSPLQGLYSQDRIELLDFTVSTLLQGLSPAIPVSNNFLCFQEKQGKGIRIKLAQRGVGVANGPMRKAVA